MTLVEGFFHLGTSKTSRDVETSQHPTVVQVSWRISAWCPAMFDCFPLIRQTSPVRRVAVLGGSVICWPIWQWYEKLYDHYWFHTWRWFPGHPLNWSHEPKQHLKQSPHMFDGNFGIYDSISYWNSCFSTTKDGCILWKGGMNKKVM